MTRGASPLCTVLTVTTADDADEDLPSQGGAVCTLILRVRRDEMMTGSIGLVGRPRTLSFRGWIDFMTALHDLRSESHRSRG